MSWDVHLVQLGDVECNEAGVIVDFTPGDMGSVEECQSAIEGAFQPVTWIDVDTALYDGEGYSMEIRIPTPPVEYLMVSAWGRGNPVPELSALARNHGWRILDASAGELLDPDVATCAGWERARTR